MRRIHKPHWSERFGQLSLTFETDASPQTSLVSTESLPLPSPPTIMVPPVVEPATPSDDGAIHALRTTIRHLRRQHRSVAVTMQQQGMGSRLTVENVNAEALASSDSILAKTPYGQKGLQQFFTPPDVAQFIAQVVGTRAAVFDPTAGGGNLLAPFPSAQRFGVEISPLYTGVRGQGLGDGENQPPIPNPQPPPYHCIAGDFQRIYPLLRRCEVTFPVVVLNPPFGLRWQITSLNDGKPDDSTTLCFEACIELLDWYGVGVLIAGKDRFHREVCSRHYDKFFAVVEVPDLFENTRLASVIAFFRKQQAYGEPLTLVCPRAELEEIVELVREPLKEQGRLRLVSLSDELGQLAELWSVIAHAHRRRLQVRRDEALTPASQEADSDGSHRSPTSPRYDVALRAGRLHVVLSIESVLALQHSRDLYWVQKLHRQSPHYFALNTREWKQLVELVEEGWLTVDPALLAKVETLLSEADLLRIPLYPLKPQKRLGFLPDVDQIRCIKDDEDREFKAGEVYSVSTRSDVERSYETRHITKRDGSVEERKYLVERKVLSATIGSQTFTESSEDIRYLLEHFDLPDPGDLGSLYPDLLQKHRELLEHIETTYGFSLKQFQREDLARLLIKGGGGLCWEMGLGKSPAGMVFHVASVLLGEVKDQLLLIVPQDLIPQWQREAQKFFNRRFEVIDSHVKAHRVVQHVRSGGTGWYITYYEALSRNGRVHEQMPPVILAHKAESAESDGNKPNPSEAQTTVHTSAEYCPVCLADTDEGWDGDICCARLDGHIATAAPDIYWWQDMKRQRLFRARRPLDLKARLENGNGNGQRDTTKICGYIHRRLHVKPVASLLSTAFRQGSIVVDEAVKIQGDDSLMSRAVRGLRAKRKLILSGEPIKNYLHQVYWLLWFALGNNSPQFPFDYRTGKTKFIETFCVVEYLLDKWGRKEGRQRVKPEVTNVSLLWRLFDTNLISRRMEETGEPLVPLTYHPVHVRFGTQQKEAYENWLYHFDQWFQETHPYHFLSGRSDLIQLMSATLGQYAKLQIASVLPNSQPDDWWTSPNMTPKNFAALRKVCELVQEGHKVVVFSARMEFGKWFAERLQEKGVDALHIVEGKDGKWTTKGPSKRASLVKDFIEGKSSVLCCGIEAMNLGHNLDVASKVVIVGLPWGMDTLRQAMARVRRLTSKKPVDAYLFLTEGSIDERIYSLIGQKKAAAHLALHGELLKEEVEEITQQQFLNQLRKWGIPVQETIDETHLQQAWERYRLLAVV